MHHFKDNINDLILKKEKDSWELTGITLFLFLIIISISFLFFKNALKSDIINNKKEFNIPVEYLSLNYKGTDDAEEEYLEAFDIYKDIIENPKNDFEKAISYNLSYLEKLSDGRLYMVKMTNQKLTKDSFIKEKNKYDLNISKEDKNILVKNSQVIRQNIESIEKTKDKFVLLNSLETLDYILDLKVEDEVLFLSKLFKVSLVDYFLAYFVNLFISIMLITVILKIYSYYK